MEPAGTGPAEARPNLGRNLLGALLIVSACIALTLFFLGRSGTFSGPRGDLDISPAWSPDGRKIAYVSDRGGNTDVYVMNADGTDAVQLTKDSFAQLYFLSSPSDLQPSWSPDGRRIVFVSGRENSRMNYVDTDIFTMDADGSNQVNLGFLGSVEVFPVWSPTGGLIAFASDKGSPPAFHVYSMKEDGSGAQSLAEGNQPAWSHDGRRIAFVSSHGGNSHICTMEADGSHIAQLTNDPHDDDLPTWSPDGSQIAFASHRDGVWNVYVMKADGSDVKPLTHESTDNDWPAWSPDGRRIAFVSKRAGSAHIYLMDADGAHVTQVTGNARTQ